MNSDCSAKNKFSQAPSEQPLEAPAAHIYFMEIDHWNIKVRF